MYAFHSYSFELFDIKIFIYNYIQFLLCSNIRTQLKLNFFLKPNSINICEHFYFELYVLNGLVWLTESTQYSNYHRIIGKIKIIFLPSIEIPYFYLTVERAMFDLIVFDSRIYTRVYKRFFDRIRYRRQFTRLIKRTKIAGLVSESYFSTFSFQNVIPSAIHLTCRAWM